MARTSTPAAAPLAVRSAAGAATTPDPAPVAPAAGGSPAAAVLAGRGADINWHAPWSGETPLDAARDKHERAVAAWLTESGAASR